MLFLRFRCDLLRIGLQSGIKKRFYRLGSRRKHAFEPEGVNSGNQVRMDIYVKRYFALCRHVDRICGTYGVDNIIYTV